MFADLQSHTVLQVVHVCFLTKGHSNLGFLGDKNKHTSEKQIFIDELAASKCMEMAKKFINKIV